MGGDRTHRDPPTRPSWSNTVNDHEPSEITLRDLLATASPLVKGLLEDLLATEPGRSFIEQNLGLLLAEAEFIDTL